MGIVLELVQPADGHDGKGAGQFRHKKTALLARLADDGLGMRHRGRAGAAFGRRAAASFVIAGHMRAEGGNVNGCVQIEAHRRATI